MYAFSRAVEIAYSTSNVWDGIPYVFVAIAIFAGGLVAWSFMFCGLEWLFFCKERRKFYILKGLEDHRENWVVPKGGVFRNLGHLLMISVFFIGIVIIIWVSASVIGLNPWSSAAATLSLGVVLTYSFASLLGHFSSGISTLATNSIAVGQYWEFAGYPGYEGFVHSIEKLAVYLTRFNKETNSGEIIYIPMSFFTNNVRKRNVHKENTELTGVKSKIDDDNMVPAQKLETRKRFIKANRIDKMV